jgi:succinyl-diaminopimelate desuccinylase
MPSPGLSALERVLAEIHGDEVIDLTRRLVRIPSVHRPGEAGADESAVARAIAEWFWEEGFTAEIQEVAPGRPNVIGWIDGRRRGPTLCLEGHTDVVTEGDAAEWRHGPWAGIVEEGRIYGRGSADMKGGLAAAMVAAAAVRWSGVDFAGRLMVAALVDEEGAMAGARHFMRSPLGEQVDAAIICEPEQNELCLEQRGVIWIRAVVRGKMAHGAMPYAGVNPIPAAATFLDGLRAAERRIRAGARRSRYLGTASVTPTAVQAPATGMVQPNVIPSAASLCVDVRLVPGVRVERVLAALRDVADSTEARWPGITVALEPLGPPRPATRTRRTEAVVRALVWAVETVTGRAPRFGGVPGSTDGTIFVTERRIPIVTFGPGRREVPHQVDEYVEVSELMEATRCYAGAAVRFLDAVG